MDIAENKKCSGKLKCAQFPGIKNIQGIFYGKANTRSGNILAKPMELGVRLGEKLYPIDFSGNSKDFIVVDADMILGILIQKKGDTLDFCNPTLIGGKRSCHYQDESPGYKYTKMVADCKLSRADKCKCDDFYLRSETNSDSVIGQESGATVVGSYNWDTRELNVAWYPKTDLCLYTTEGGAEDVETISGYLAKTGGYLGPTGNATLVSVNGKVCIAKQDDPLLKNIVYCKDKKASVAPVAAPPTNLNQQTTSSPQATASQPSVPLR